MRKIDFKTKSITNPHDIKNVIENALKNEFVVENGSEAEKWFRENFGDDEKSVHHDTFQREIIDIWNDDYNVWDRWIAVIMEHYVDPGSVDYLYSYEIFCE